MTAAAKRVEYVPRCTCPLHDPSRGQGNQTLRLWDTIRDAPSLRTFRILRCATCGVALTDPYPSESTLKWLYVGRQSVSNFDPIAGTIMDRLKGWFARRDIRYAHAVGGSPSVTTVLDYGAGSGRFSLACKQVFRACAVDAVDFDEEPPPELRDVPGLRYLQHEAFLGESRQYDFIVLRAVLEHVHDPIGTLRALSQRLSPGGMLYLEVPCIDSAYIHYFGRSCNAYGVPYHLFNFDFGSLRLSLREAGLSAKVFAKGLPLAGCVLATTLRQERSLAHQMAGVLLHPVQLCLEARRGKYILAAVCTKRHSDGLIDEPVCVTMAT